MLEFTIPLCFTIIYYAIAFSLFFTGCDYKYTHFCPRYDRYNGVIYYIGAKDPGYNSTTYNTKYTNVSDSVIHLNEFDIPKRSKRSLRGYYPPPPPPSTTSSDDDEVYYTYYAINLMTLDKCHISDENFEYLQVGDTVNWYKFKTNREECERTITVETRWMAGLVLLCIPVGICVLGCIINHNTV